MNQRRRPCVLLASHDTTALPAVAEALAARGIDVLHSGNVVDTAARIADGAPDLVVLQPLSGDLDGFEIQHVMALRGEERPYALLLVLREPAAAERLLERPSPAIDEFLVGPASAAELLLRIDAVLRRKDAVVRLEREARSLAQETMTDFKTGLHNDRYFFQRLRQEVERSRRHRLSLALALIDFDDFKSINEKFDHTFGDYVLGAFARKLRAAVRQIDIAARLGGDEFALLLPNTDLEEAALLATRLRALLAETRFEKNGRATTLGLSIGIDATPGEDGLEPEDFLRRADLALLEAKRRGKNRICLYPELSPKPA
jgi:two-component system cell cycle response regulator